MNYILTILIGLVLVTSCTNRTKQGGKRELVPNPEKYVHDGYFEQPDTLKPKFKPDTVIGQISLINSENVDTYLGENVMEKLADEVIPYSNVISRDSKQQLTFYFHPGRVKKEFSEFEVSYLTRKDRNARVIKEKEFITENGIKLGMTMGEFRSIKGEPDTITNGKTTIFHYQIDDFENSEFLKKYNMPIYYADYKFKNGYLNEFRFGFQYP